MYICFIAKKLQVDLPTWSESRSSKLLQVSQVSAVNIVRAPADVSRYFRGDLVSKLLYSIQSTISTLCYGPGATRQLYISFNRIK